MCKLCVKEISFDHKHGIHNVNMHLDTNKHKDEIENNDSTQEFIEISLERMENNQFRNEFFAHLTKAFVESNIPLDKLDKHSLREFFKKYMKRDIPTPHNLGHNYVTKIYENVISKKREVLGDNPIYLIVDETMDKRYRYVVNAIVGALNGNQSKPMLISTTFQIKLITKQFLNV